MEITANINSGQVFSLEPTSTIYHPGEVIVYQVTINNYQDDLITETGFLPLPQDLKGGEFLLVAYGGPRPEAIAPTKEVQNLEDFISYIQGINSYEHLSVELLRPLKEQLVPIWDGYSYRSIIGKDKRYPDRVIYGRRAVSISVVEEK